MGKTAFCICENKDADQLCGNNEADQRLCFRYAIVQFLYFLNFKPLAICGCTACFFFLSHLVGNPEDLYSRDEAHIGACAVNETNMLI